MREARVSENRVYALVVFGDVEQGDVSVAIVPHSSFRATVPQGFVLGIHEGEIVERRECDVDEVGVENACETGKDDMADR